MNGIALLKSSLIYLKKTYPEQKYLKDKKKLC